MIRKLVLALGATTAIAVAALVPTSASAHFKGGYHGHGGFGFYGPAYVTTPVLVDAPTCYYVKQPVMTPFGWQVQKVQVCE
jgi:hypothetical protein